MTYDPVPVIDPLHYGDACHTLAETVSVKELDELYRTSLRFRDLVRHAIEKVDPPQALPELVQWAELHVLIGSKRLPRSFQALFVQPGYLPAIANDALRWGEQYCETHRQYRSGTLLLYSLWETHGGRISTFSLQIWLSNAIKKQDHGLGALFCFLVERLRTPKRYLLDDPAIAVIVEALVSAHRHCSFHDGFEVDLMRQILKARVSPTAYDRVVAAYRTAIEEWTEKEIEISLRCDNT